MNLRDRVLHWVLNRLFKSREVWKPEGLYLKRWYVTPLRWLEKWPLLLWWVPKSRRKQVFLHNIRLPDSRVPHDHPWSFKSLILLGSYTEHCFPVYRCSGMSAHIHNWNSANLKFARPGTVLRNPVTHVHFVTVRRPVWSLVVAGKPERVWGFWINADTWVDWRTYLDLPNEPDSPEDKVKTT